MKKYLRATALLLCCLIVLVPAVTSAEMPRQPEVKGIVSPTPYFGDTVLTQAVNPQAGPVTSTVPYVMTRRYSLMREMLTEINNWRRTNGKSPLRYNSGLEEFAMQRGAEIALYFEHYRPQDPSQYTFIPGVNGENIALGYTTVKAVMEGWKDSPGHNENMLRAEFKSVAFGAVEDNGTMYWVQVFSLQTGDQAPAEKEDTRFSGTITAARDNLAIATYPEEILTDAAGKFPLTVEIRYVKGEQSGAFDVIYPDLSRMSITSNNPEVANFNTAGSVITVNKKGRAVITVATPNANPVSRKIPVNYRAVTLNGWHVINGHTKYFVNGEYVTGLKKIGKTRYLFNADGERQYGWHKVGGKEMYFNTKNGGLWTGKRKIGNTVYLLGSDGGKLYGWHRLGGNDYYFDPDFGGGMITGKRRVGNTVYFFNSKGYKDYGWKLLNGRKYYFDKRYGGGMITGLRTVGGGTYYFIVDDSAPGANDKGAALVNGSRVINGKTYYFNASGLLYRVE